MNFVSITLDDLNAFAFAKSLYGATLHTPHLDRLMAMGTTFENSFAQVAVCNASRTSVLTGQGPGRTGVHANSELWYDHVDPASTLPAQLKSAGYDTSIIGKVFHLLSMPQDVAGAVGDRVYANGDNRYFDADILGTRPLPTGIETHSDYINVSKAISLLNSGTSDPFALFVGIGKPHLGWVVPQKFFDLYPLESIELPFTMTDDLDDIPHFMRELVNTDDHKQVLDAGFWKSALQGYFASISFADEMVGRLLDTLEANGQMDNTAILLWTDHGYHLGDKDNWHKFTLWEEAARAPFVLALPGSGDNGQRVKQAVELVDIMPTILDLLDLQAPAGLSGRSLLPFVQNPSLLDGGVAVTTMYGSAAIRTNSYRYIRYEDGSTELYNLLADPHQWHNLSGKRGAAAIEQSLESRLKGELAADGWIWADTGFVYGGNGDQTFVVEPGVRTVGGGSGADTYFVSGKGAIIVEEVGGGLDTIYTQGNYRLPKNVENLNLKLQSIRSELIGNELDNVIRGGGILRGEGGNDTLHGAASEDILSGGDGDDTLIGNSGADYLEGGSGGDILDGGPGADVMAGGAGNDVYRVDHYEDRLLESAAPGIDTVHSRVNLFLGADFENLRLIGASAIRGYGNELDNDIIGSAAANLLDGRAGADILQGGAGGDTYWVDNAGDRVVELTTLAGTDHIYSSVSYILPTGVESLALLGAARLAATGNGANNIISGNSAGNSLSGGAGADLLSGGLGDDVYWVDNARDRIREFADAGRDEVRATVTVHLSANVESLFLIGLRSISGHGNAADNLLVGNASANHLNGKGGADRLVGGLGNDTYRVDDVRDALVEGAAEGIDSVVSTVHYTLSRNVEALSLQGAADLSGTGNNLANGLSGNRGANKLYGLGGNDDLYGGAGNDRLAGGAGRDELRGGLGSDQFLFDTRLNPVTNVDVLADFGAGDVVRLDRAIFDNIAREGRLAAEAFRLGASARDASDRILYDSRTGRLFYDEDGSGSAQAVLFARVDAGTLVTSTDFYVHG